MISAKKLLAENEALRQELGALRERVDALEKANPLFGKKYYACGDSFTQGDFSGFTDESGLTKEESPVIFDKEWNMYKTYPWWIGRRNHMTVINEARRGSTIALDKDYVAGLPGVARDHLRPFILDRYLQIPEDTDYCTIWFGINDSAHTLLGEPDDVTPETYYGAWNIVLEWILTNRPYMKLGIIVTNDAAPEWREATRTAAKRWGVPYLDMTGDPSVPLIINREESLGCCEKAQELRKSVFYVTKENDHPNLRAHEYQSYFIEEFMRRL